MSCPWGGLRGATISFCEESLCAFVRSPANTWSNLAYAVVALWFVALWLLGRTRDRGMSPFAWVAGAVGVCSFLFHASLTFLFQIFDYASMFLFTGLMIVLNLERLRPGWRRRRARSYAALVAGSLLPLALGGQVGRLVFAVHVAVLLATERACARAAPGEGAAAKEIDYRPYALMLGIFAGAYVFWSIDNLRLWCHPQNHLIQGHAIWHVLSSLCFVAAHRFYAQFPTCAARSAIPERRT